AHVTRPYSHSLSDDEKLYKTPAERANEQSRDPIDRFAAVLRARGAATDADLSATLAAVEAEVNEAALAALHAPKPAPDTAALWVYSPDVDPTSDTFDTPAQNEG